VRRREARFAKASRELFALARSWERERGALEELHGLVGEVQAMRGQAESFAAELGDLALRAKAVGTELRHASASARKSTDAEVRAMKAREEAEGAWGPLDVLIQARTRAEGLTAAQRSADSVRERLAEARESAPELVVMLEGARAVLRQFRVRLQQAERGVARREEALESAQADDHVAALVAGKKAGDPCPVCGIPLGRLPKRRAAGAVAKARTALETARLNLQAANEDLVGKEKAVQAAEKDVEAALAQERRLAGELEEREQDLAELFAELQPILGAPSPLDPVGELSSRVARLRALLEAEANAADARERSEKDLARAEHERDRTASATAELRARLATDPGPLLKRAVRAGGGSFVPPDVPRLPRTIDPGSVGAFAADLAKALGLVADSLQDAVSARGASGPLLFEKARSLVPEPFPDAGDLEELVEAVGAAARAATAEAAEATQRAANLAEKIESRRELQGEAAEAARRSTLFRALAAELRADRLIAFLQAEALHVLAAAGSQRLQTLSEGRYRLACRDDEFLVVDTWNGDDERSVRTLSGGETFLASLALALALSEQVRSLSVTDRARLESLFLDEGFGTLDSEALVVVVDAIERLGGDGRLVGVITHVGELAEQFPRVEVEKSPRGSRLKLVAT
jgi:exonuclease SbcC